MARFCTKCGTELKEAEQFCTACGTAAGSPAKAPSDNVAPAPEATEKKGRGPAALLIAGAGFVIALGAVLWSRSGETPPAPVSPPPAAATSPVSPVVRPAPAPAASAPAGTTAPVPQKSTRGSWDFSSNEDGIQLVFKAPPTSDDYLVRFSCNLDDGVLRIDSRAILGAKVSELADQPHGLDLTISGAGAASVGRGYPVSTPEEVLTSWEVARSPVLMRAFQQSALLLKGPDLTIGSSDGQHSEAIAAFAGACPPVAVDDADPLGWGTQTSRSYGYRLQIPKKLFHLAIGDREVRQYRTDTPNGALVVYNHVDVLQETLDKAIGMIEPEFDKITYTHRTADTIVKSGYAGSMIVYFKARSTCGRENIVSVSVMYDDREKAKFDPVVKRIADSLDANVDQNGRPLCP